MRGLRESDWATDPWAEDVPEPRPVLESISAPPGLPFNAVVVAALAVLLVVAATPGAGWGAVPSLAVLALLGAVWLARLPLYVVARAAGRQSRRSRGFLAAPAAVVIAAVLVVLNVPVRVGFELSRPHFDDLAEQLLTGDQPEGVLPASGPDDDEERFRLGGRRVGLYALDDATVEGRGVMLHVDGTGGFAYFADGSPSARWSGQMDLVVLGGGWYAFDYDF